MSNPDYPAPVKRPLFVLDIDASISQAHDLTDDVGYMEEVHNRIQALYERSNTDRLRKISANALRWMGFVFCVLLLTACGGGSGGGDDSAQPEPIEGQIPLNIDPGVSQNSRAAITTWLSSFSSSSAVTGNALDAENLSEAEGEMVLALDGSDNLLLAGSVQNGSVQLSIRSTALWLIELVSGDASMFSNSSELDGFISASIALPDLERTLSIALEEKRPPLEDKEVLSALIRTVSEVLGEESSSEKPARLSALSVTEPTLESLPHPVVDDSVLQVPARVSIEKIKGNGNIVIRNTTPLVWAIRSTKSDGSPIAIDPVGDDVDGSKMLYGVDFKSAAINAIVPSWWWTRGLMDLASLGGNTSDVKASPELGTDIVIAQNDATWKRNVSLVAIDIMSHILSPAIKENQSQCAESMSSFMDFEALDKAAGVLGSRDPRAVLDLKFENFLKFSFLLVKCLPVVSDSKADLLEQLISVESLVIRNALVQAYEMAETSLTVVTRLRMMSTYSDKSFVTGVCHGKSTLTNNYWHIKCSDQLSILPPEDPAPSRLRNKIETPAMMVGTTLDLEVLAKDVNGNSVEPASLQYSAEPEGIVDVQGSGTHFQVSALLQLGGAIVTVKDQATDESTWMQFRVVEPVVIADKNEVAVGEDVEIRLVDPLARSSTVFTKGANIQFTSSDESKLVLEQINNDGVIAGRALASSSAPITVTAWWNDISIGKVDINITSNIDYSDFRFEVLDASAGTLVCVDVKQGGIGAYAFYYDYQACSRYVTPQIRCIGDGCIPGRFSFFAQSYTQQWSYPTLRQGSDGITCQTQYSEYQSYQPGDDIYSSNDVRWKAVSNDFTYLDIGHGANIYNHHLSGFDRTFYRNIDNIDDRSGNTDATRCAPPDSYLFGIPVIIFDGRTSEYLNLSYSLSLPANGE